MEAWTGAGNAVLNVIMKGHDDVIGIHVAASNTCRHSSNICMPWIVLDIYNHLMLKPCTTCVSYLITGPLADMSISSSTALVCNYGDALAICGMNRSRWCPEAVFLMEL